MLFGLKIILLIIIIILFVWFTAFYLNRRKLIQGIKAVGGFEKKYEVLLFTLLGAPGMTLIGSSNNALHLKFEGKFSKGEIFISQQYFECIIISWRYNHVQIKETLTNTFELPTDMNQVNMAQNINDNIELIVQDKYGMSFGNE